MLSGFVANQKMAPTFTAFLRSLATLVILSGSCAISLQGSHFAQDWNEHRHFSMGKYMNLGCATEISGAIAAESS
jgi:hypothetical protein